MEFKDNIKDSIEIGYEAKFCFCKKVMFVLLDPRITALTESKYKEFRGWFDQRLDDAIAAAEAGSSVKPAIEGIIIPNCPISEYILPSNVKIIKTCGHQRIVPFLVHYLFYIFSFLSRCFYILIGPHRKTVLRYAFSVSNVCFLL